MGCAMQRHSAFGGMPHQTTTGFFADQAGPYMDGAGTFAYTVDLADSTRHTISQLAREVQQGKCNKGSATRKFQLLKQTMLTLLMP